MIKRLSLLFCIIAISLSGMAQDDFGYDLSIAGETKIAKGLKFEFEGGMRTQDDAERIDRFEVGAGLSYRLYQSLDKKITLKANAGFEYLWTNRLKETENKYFEAEDDLVKQGFFNAGDLKGYNITNQYWRNRYRINPSLAFSYSPNKRWSFSLKEIVQFTHYCEASTTRTKWRVDEYNSILNNDGSINWIISPYQYNDDLYVDDQTFDENGNVLGKVLNQSEITKNYKDCTVLRSRLSASYDIKGFPIDIVASIEYGCGLNYKANKWKFMGGYDYKINKTNKLTVFYRYTTEDDDDEVNGHLVGLGYKVDF